jgi:hypothetical protein
MSPAEFWTIFEAATDKNKPQPVTQDELQEALDEIHAKRARNSQLAR